MAERARSLPTGHGRTRAAVEVEVEVGAAVVAIVGTGAEGCVEVRVAAEARVAETALAGAGQEL